MVTPLRSKAELSGWCGRILVVDVSSGRVREERLPETVYREFIGGRGLGGYLLRDFAALPWNSPDMPVILLAGPLCGTIAPTSGRAVFMSRSPLTGLISDSSVGGRLGTELKRAGWDAVVIAGVGSRLCGIEIEDRRVTIRPLSQWAGLDTWAVFDRLGSGKSVAAVGPAAEQGVRFAGIMVDRHHAAGRTGLGACLAFKKVKYLAVKGSGKVDVRDRAGLKRAREEILRLTAASPVLLGEHGFACFGTGALFDLTDSRRMMPTDNFSRTHFSEARRLNAYAYKTSYHPSSHGCLGCHIRCKRVAPGGMGLPEFETMSHFTALIGNADLALVVEANDLCNRLGMDTISAAATLACHREITGDPLTPVRVLELLQAIGRGEGIGGSLGMGSRAYAGSMGRPESSMSVKGLELPAYDPRGAYGMALAYAVASRGGCHLRAYPISHEILRKPVATDRFDFSGKARIVKIAEDQNAVVDSLIVCKFTFLAATLEEYAQAFTAATGVSSSAQDLLAAGERICYQERILNAVIGVRDRDDDLPERFFREPGSGESPWSIPPIDRSDFLAARNRYYRIRGLDPTGRPLEETARMLSLPWNG